MTDEPAVGKQGADTTDIRGETPMRGYRRLAAAVLAFGLAGGLAADGWAQSDTSQAFSSGLVAVTRPADTTAYAARDVVGATAAVWTFPLVCPGPGRRVYVSSTEFTVRVAAVPSGMTSFRLHLYNATPPSAYADNAAWELADADLGVYQGYVELGSPVDEGSNLYVQADGIQHAVRCGASTSLFGYLMTMGAYTPSSAAVKTIHLHSVAP